jgi:nucleotide-binding universal stress UspA family protein
MTTINRILCPIDFSEYSRHAFNRAAALARAHGASITALHVAAMEPRYTPFLVNADVPIPVGVTPEQRATLRRELSAFVQLDAADAVPVDTEVVDAPSIHGEIVAQAARLGADLIVMGTHGRGGFERLLLGSVTEKVLRTARQPVLTVGGTNGRGDTTAFKHILCGVDFSDCSLAALNYALTMAEGAAAQVTVVNVLEWMPVGYDPLVGPPTDLVGYRIAAEASAKERLHEVVARANRNNVLVEEVVTAGKPHHEMLRIARDCGSDLIVLGIHGRNPLDRMFFGSTAEPVVRRAPCPVLTVRAQPTASTAAA